MPVTINGLCEQQISCTAIVSSYTLVSVIVLGANISSTDNRRTARPCSKE
jgi:hypothetical protein